MMQKRGIMKKSIISLLIVLFLALVLCVSACHISDDNKTPSEITFENVTFVDGEELLSPEGNPNPNDYIPEKEGHVFRYWVYKRNNISTIFKIEDYDGSPITLYAVWKANEYVVTFLDFSNNPLKVNGKNEQKVKHGASAVIPEIPQIEGYKFIAWDKPTDNITQNTDIKAIYEKTEFSINFFFGDETLLQKYAYSGDKIKNFEKEAVNALSQYTSRGLALECWYADIGLKNAVNLGDITVANDANFYAKLVPDDIKKLNLQSEKEDNTFYYSQNMEISINCVYEIYNLVNYKTVWYIDGIKLGESENRIFLTNPEIGKHTVKVEVSSIYGEYTKTASKTIDVFVVKKSLSVKANDLSVSYGDEKPNFTYNVEGGENIELGTASFVCNYNLGSSVGEYAIGISGLSSEIYDLTFVEGTLTVLPKDIVVKADDKTITYGDEKPAFAYSAEGILPKDSLTGGEYICDYEKGMKVGTYAVAVSNLSNPNYNVVEYKDGLLTVEKMVLQIKIESKSVVYFGDPKPEFEYKIQRGELLAGDSLGVARYNCSYARGADAQRYNVSLSGLSNPNYEIVTNVGWLTVYPKEVTVQWVAENEYTYSGLEQSEGLQAYFQDIDGETQNLRPKFVKNGEETTFVDAGEYTVEVSFADKNYKLLNSTKVLTINKRSITINVNDAVVTYGDDIPEYTYTVEGIVGNDNLGKVLFNCAYIKGSKIGDYQLKAVGFENPNYEISYNNAILTVQKRPVKVEWSVGGAYTYNGKIQSDTIHALFRKYDGKNTVMTLTYYLSERVASFKNAGLYKVVASADDTNYELIDNEQMIEIQPKSLLVKLENKSITYGDPSPLFSFETEGLAVGENENVLGKIQYVCAYSRGSDAGEYEISCENLKNDNYSISYESATLTVNKMSVEAIWSFEESYVYNGRNQNDTVSVKIRGFAGNYLAMNVAFSSGENKDFCHAGTYTVTAFSEDERNYIVNHKERTLEIACKNATLSACYKVISYGDSIPEFAYTATGLEGEDELGDMEYVCAYVQGSPSAKYSIDIAPIISNDYNLSYVGATLNVINRLVEIEWSYQDSYTYNKNEQSNSVIAKFVGYSGNYEIADLTFVLNGEESNFKNAGKYQISATHTDENYTLLNEKKELVIEKKGVSVVPNELSVTFGSVAPNYTYTVTGLEEGDELFGETFECSYFKGANVGEYALLVDFVEQENYSLSLSSSVLRVNPLSVSVVWNFGNIIYNGQSQENAVNAKFVTFDGKDEVLPVLFKRNGNVESFKNANSYTAEINYETPNYILSNTQTTVAILPKALSVVLDNKNLVFGDKAEFTHKLIGLVEGENESVLGEINYLCSYAVGANVGSYAIDAEGLENSNYEITYTQASLVVSKREAITKWTTQSEYVYNGSEQTNAVIAGYNAYTGEYVPMDIYITKGNSTFKNAGVYEFTARNLDENYSIKENVKEIQIKKANYKNITHAKLVGIYDPEIRLSAYMLDEGYRWADANILPTVKRTEYNALYNLDAENYNDFELTVNLVLAKANYSSITHKTLSGKYDEKKSLNDYALSQGFAWKNKSIVPTVDQRTYQAIYNADKDNYNDFELEIGLQLEKADYSSITHTSFTGVYSPTENLSRFELSPYYRWENGNIIPTVNTRKYRAIYNKDSVNYNDFVLEITVYLSKANYTASEVPIHSSLNGTYNSSGKLSDYTLSDNFKWKSPTTKPTVSKTTYDAYYNADSVNYNNYALKIELILKKANYGAITHKALSGNFDANKTLKDYKLDANFSWVDESIVPSSEYTQYKAIYNADTENYNDKELYITLTVAKVDYTGEIHNKQELRVIYDENKTLSDYELPEGFVWKDPTFSPTLGRDEYEVYYNPYPYGYNSVLTTIVLVTVKE